MELGHNIVVPDGELCNCGKKGCLEAYASVQGMLNRIAQLPEGDLIKTMTNIVSAAPESCAVAAILQESMEYLSWSIANLVINLDADRVVLGGGVLDIPEYDVAGLVQRIKRYLPAILRDSVNIHKAKLGNKAGISGAIYLAEMMHKTKSGMKLAIQNE
jgi:glucokinase